MSTIDTRRAALARGITLGAAVLSYDGEPDGSPYAAMPVTVLALSRTPRGGILPMIRYADGSTSFGIGAGQRLRPAHRLDRA